MSGEELGTRLTRDPVVLLADEPTGSLDPGSRQLVLGLLERLRSEEGVTILVVTHDDAVGAAADRTIHLRERRVVDG